MSLLYSLYSLPNVLLSTVGSVMMERIGLGKGLVLLQFLVLAGLVLSILSVQYEKFYLMLIGRTFFGVGSELLSIGQATVSDLWFNGKYLSIALSLNRFCTYSFMAFGAFVLPELFFRRINQVSRVDESRKDQLRSGLSLVLVLTLVFASAVSLLTIVYYFLEKKYLPILKHKMARDFKKDLFRRANANTDGNS